MSTCAGQARRCGPALALAFMCSSCDYTQYSTKAGEHVVYHWDADAWAAEDEQLCGGTVQAADRFVAGIANYYGWPLGQQGPTIEYFWDRALTTSACTWIDGAACEVEIVSPMVFSFQAFDSHELAHTAKGGTGHAAFVNEAFAARWTSGVIAGDYTFPTSPNFIGEDQLRAQLKMGFVAQVDMFMGLTWWVALETTYGPAKMAEFIAELDTTSARDVERALQQVFGISLAESAALAEALPSVAIDDPVCTFDGLPTLVWSEDEQLVIDRTDARCEDDDLISMAGQRAKWLVALEFPEHEVEVTVHVTAPEGDLIQKMLVVATCNGELTHGELSYDPLSADPPDSPGTPRRLGGHYVAGLVGVIAADGSVAFPRVVIEEALP
jgi:hypothetical protein